ncbi:hypothetical protein Plhal304r1_c008g0034051 [Plasmopara halstedii]
MNEARENFRDKGYSVDLSSLFHQTKRPCAEDTTVENDMKITDESSANASPQNNLTLPSTVASPWRLPRNQTLMEIQTYLNEQLQHVMALSSMFGPRYHGPENDTRRYLTRANDAKDDIEKVCTLDLTEVRSLTAVEAMQQTEEQIKAECEVRELMDLVSYLLYVLNRELDHQNQLSENLSRAEKLLERKNNIVQALTADLKTIKRDLALRENSYRAKEQDFIAERKSLQTTKKTLEMSCARLQGVETAFKAHLKRKDVEYSRLRKKLEDVIVRAAKEKQGIAITKVLNGARELKKASSANLSKESMLTCQILDNLERKKAELLLDYEALAKSYDTVQNHLASLTSQYKKAVRLFLAQKNFVADAEELNKLASSPIDDFVPTPFNMATKNSIPGYIFAAMEVLQEKLKQLEHVIRNEVPYAEAKNDKEVIKRLQEKLDDAHSIINDQDQLLQASLIPHAPNTKVCDGKIQYGAKWVELKNATFEGSIRSSPDAVIEEEVKQEKYELALIRQNLEKERQLLQEQAVKLDKDRLEFEITKRDQFFGYSRDAALPQNCEQTSPSLNHGARSSLKRQRRAQHLEVENSHSSFDIPISATPDTAALLQKIGVNVPIEK